MKSGSIEDIVARLLLWSKRAPKGFARVEFDSEFARQRVVHQVRAELAAAGIPFHEIALPIRQPASHVVNTLLARLYTLSSGVVSLSGFATAFADNVSLEDSLRVFNFQRENLARPAVCQIWWLSSSLAEQFVRSVPDLDSWFMVRVHLTEVVAPPTEERHLITRSTHATVNIDDARRRAAALTERFGKALAAGASASELRQSLAIPAVNALLEAGAEREAIALEARLMEALRQGTPLLDQEGELPPNDHPSVAITPSFAFQQVKEKSPAAADLVCVCAFLAPDAIPEEIFTEGGMELGEHLRAIVTNPTDFLNTLKEAERFSLIDHNPSNKTFNIHRLVQDAVKDGMNEATQRLWAERTVRTLNRVFPGVTFPQWPLCERLLPHAQLCADLIAGYHFEFPEAARLLNQIGLYLLARAQYAQAEPLFQRALTIRETVLGPDHPDTAQSLNNLAALYRNQGLYPQAEPLYQRALAILENVLGPEHPATAISLDNLALLYDNQGLYTQAEPFSQRALAIREQVLGPEHPDTATSLNNLAALYDDQGRYAQAEPLYQRALAIREQVLGPEHPDTAASLNNLALLYDDQGRYAQAEPLYQRALAVLEKSLGPEHPHVAMLLESYAGLLRKIDREAEAEKLIVRAQGIREKRET